MARGEGIWSSGLARDGDVCARINGMRFTIVPGDSHRFWRSAIAHGVLLTSVFAASTCKRSTPIIAVIPRTCGTALWEPEHAGAAAVARADGLDIYWNAPMRD